VYKLTVFGHSLDGTTECVGLPMSRRTHLSPAHKPGMLPSNINNNNNNNN